MTQKTFEQWWKSSKWAEITEHGEVQFHSSQDAWRTAEKGVKKRHKESLLFAGHVYQFIGWMDEEMKKPSDNERGKRVAKALNALEMSADRFSHFSLNQSFEEIKKMKNKKVKP